MPNLYSIIGLAFIIVGVLMVNLLGNNWTWNLYLDIYF
jgi:small multidrug resistance pump